MNYSSPTPPDGLKFDLREEARRSCQKSNSKHALTLSQLNNHDQSSTNKADLASGLGSIVGETIASPCNISYPAHDNIRPTHDISFWSSLYRSFGVNISRISAVFAVFFRSGVTRAMKAMTTHPSLVLGRVECFSKAVLQSALRAVVAGSSMLVATVIPHFRYLVRALAGSDAP